jgi:hypothetical protein
MKSAIGILALLISQMSFAQNWMVKTKPGQKCMPSYFMNMKPIGEPTGNSLEVSQKTSGVLKDNKIVGNSSKGKIALIKTKYDSVGDFVDIGVEYVGHEQTYDLWKECDLRHSK